MRWDETAMKAKASNSTENSRFFRPDRRKAMYQLQRKAASWVVAGYTCNGSRRCPVRMTKPGRKKSGVRVDGRRNVYVERPSLPIKIQWDVGVPCV
jgi:hypothetical protein